MRRLLIVITVLGLARPAVAALPEAVPELPVLGVETVTGSIVTSEAPNQAPSAKTIDGDPSDWVGRPTMLGGQTVTDRGELIYTDFINDAWGADDGEDAERLATLDALKQAEPRTYRIDALQQAAGDQFDAPRPIGVSTHYGDSDLPDATRYQGDASEVRVAADADRLYLLVRTLKMDAEPATTVRLTLGTTTIDISATGPLCAGCEVAYRPDGFVNAVEFSMPRPEASTIAVVTGAGGQLLNVAFRSEPARIWMDRNQALGLLSTDAPARHALDLDALAAGATQTWQQRPGYYERHYVDEGLHNAESGSSQYFQGPLQHFGLYLPKTWRPGTTMPATFWMHYRGGHAHDAAAWEPNIIRSFGDDLGGIVVTPSARGTSSWYTGRGMTDFLSVWDDVFANYRIDDDRVYVAGHSMGGWASWLLGLTMPDRFAASNPENGLLVPGLWTGLEEPSGGENGQDGPAVFLYPLRGNARNLPYAILHGTEDELCPVSAAVVAGQGLHDAGYRYRTYLFHTYEHYSAPIWDDWKEIVGYFKVQRRDRDPARVTFSVKPALDHAVSTTNSPVDLGFRFDKAYWVSDLRTRTPGLEVSNIGTIDATSEGRGVPQVLLAPEAGTGGQYAPYTMHGQRWVPNGTTAPANRFSATLTNLSQATLDATRMGLGTSSQITANITSDGDAVVRLTGTWAAAPNVTGAAADWDPSGLTLHIPDGTTNVVIG